MFTCLGQLVVKCKKAHPIYSQLSISKLSIIKFIILVNCQSCQSSTWCCIQFDSTIQQESGPDSINIYLQTESYLYSTLAPTFFSLKITSNQSRDCHYYSTGFTHPVIPNFKFPFSSESNPDSLYDLDPTFQFNQSSLVGYFTKADAFPNF
ncbi:hypothetical protein pb186bvf_019044 [Paramecium bursaria]